MILFNLCRYLLINTSLNAIDTCFRLSLVYRYTHIQQIQRKLVKNKSKGERCRFNCHAYNSKKRQKNLNFTIYHFSLTDR